ncbi:hypothetical protein GO730_20700 [Spirosoma sp. HMF3257]|uniref:Uncharacterized protein n=1 Tax=Spirosoma telluris TaxID=2183553 RepID=A0A327NKR9_9BACT|nr:hypothetical protein [Spirosoma telluris]RAI75971.1 hypothetical protein HMF3257_20620 [Spirosoma telluris]
MLDRLLELWAKYPIDLFSHLSSSLPIVLGAIRLKSLNKSAIYIWLFFIFCFAKDTYALWHVLYALNTFYIQNLEAIFQTVLIGIIYYYCFDVRLSKRIIISLTLVCLSIILFSYSEIRVSVRALSIFRLLSISLSLAYFNKILVDMRVNNVLLHTMFWFSAGLLLYASGTFFIMLFSEYWYKDINKVPAEVFDKYWNATQILFIFFCLLSAYGLWVSKYDQENLL